MYTVCHSLNIHFKKEARIKASTGNHNHDFQCTHFFLEYFPVKCTTLEPVHVNVWSVPGSLLSVNTEIKIHGKRQSAGLSLLFFQLEKGKIKTVQNTSYGWFWHKNTYFHLDMIGSKREVGETYLSRGKTFFYRGLNWPEKAWGNRTVT